MKIFLQCLNKYIFSFIHFVIAVIYDARTKVHFNAALPSAQQSTQCSTPLSAALPSVQHSPQRRTPLSAEPPSVQQLACQPGPVDFRTAQLEYPWRVSREPRNRRQEPVFSCLYSPHIFSAQSSNTKKLSPPAHLCRSDYLALVTLVPPPLLAPR